MWWTKTSGSLHDNTEVEYLLTRFDLLDHRSAVAVLHLSYVQQGVGVTVVGGPVVHEDPGAAAAAVHHNPIIQSRVQDICGLHGLCNGEVPEKNRTVNWSWNQRETTRHTEPPDSSDNPEYLPRCSLHLSKQWSQLWSQQPHTEGLGPTPCTMLLSAVADIFDCVHFFYHTLLRIPFFKKRTPIQGAKGLRDQLCLCDIKKDNKSLKEMLKQNEGLSLYLHMYLDAGGSSTCSRSHKHHYHHSLFTKSSCADKTLHKNQTCITK